MKPNFVVCLSTRTSTWSLALLCLSAPAARAQVAPAPSVPADSAPPASPGASSSATDLVKLPSFNVNETQDKGYKASNSVSGTGFNEKIQDLPFSLTALTNEYIKDIGAVDLMDAADTVAGVKSGTQEFTFGADRFLIRGFPQYPEHDGIYEGQQGNVNVDPSDIERIEVAKGPSSLLYGIVSPGGTVNYITKVASDVESYTLSVRGGSYEYYRGTLDANQPLVPGVLDFRINAAYDHGFQVEVVGNQKSTVIVPTATWNIAKNVSLRVNYQFFDRQQHPPQSGRPFFYIATPQSVVNSFNGALGYPATADAVGNVIGRSMSPFGSVDVDAGDKDGSTLYLNGLNMVPRNFDEYNQSDWMTSTNHVAQSELDFKNIGDHWNAKVDFDYNKNSTTYEETGPGTFTVAPANSLVFSNGVWSVAPAYAALTAAQQVQYNANFLTALVSNPGSAIDQYQNGTPPPFSFAKSQRIVEALGDNWTVQAEAVGSYSTPFGLIRPLIGVYMNKDMLYNVTWQTSGNATYPNSRNWDLDPLSPTYYVNNGPVQQLTKPLITDTLSYDFSQAAYAALNCSLFSDTLQIVAGVRYNRSGEASTNYLSTTASGVYVQGLMTSLPTTQVGVGYKVLPDLMVYGSFSQSYTLPATTYLSSVGYSSTGMPVAVIGASAKPVTGQGSELGIKSDLLDGRLASTLSIYQITQNDVQSTTTIPYTGPTGIVANVSLFFQGEVLRSDGLEYELTYSPTDRMQFIFNVTDDFVRVIATPPGYAYFLGSTPIYASRYLSNLWAKYQLTSHLWVAGGYKFQSKSAEQASSIYMIYPKVMEYDAAIGYSWSWRHVGYELTVNAMNLSNALTVTATQTIPLPRRFVAGLTAKF